MVQREEEKNTMDNQEYVSEVNNEQERQALLAAMHPYGENHWWESTDPKERAYYQTLEAHLKSGLWFYAPPQYQQDLVTLLARPVSSHEFYTKDATVLIQEVERAWRWNVGVTSPTERDERFNAGIRQLEQRHPNKELLFIEVEPEK